MRKQFADALRKQMNENRDIFFLCGDVGYGIFDEILESFPERSFNVGSSEQLMIGLASGLAMEGKIPICYTITPFLLYRPFEFIRNFLHHENLPVKLVGSGRDTDYSEAGFTHHATEAKTILGVMSSIQQFFPENEKQLKDCLLEFIHSNRPAFLSLRR